MATPGSVVNSGSLFTPGGDKGPTGSQGTTGTAGTNGRDGYDGNLVGTIIEWPTMTPPTGYLNADGSAQSRTTYPELFALIGTMFGAGDGATTFNLPDRRGKVGVGAGTGAGLTTRVLAAIGGEEAHATVAAEMPSHVHNMDHCHNMDHYHLIPTGQFNHGHSISDGGHAHTIPSALANWTVNSPGGTGVNACQHVTADATTTVGTGIGIYANTLPQGNTNYASQTNGNWVNTLYASQTNGAWVNTGAAGSGSAHNNMQPFLVVNYVIRVSYGISVGPTVPLADTTQAGLLTKVSGLSTDYVGGDNACHDLGSQIKLVAPVARSYNAVGNPDFEVDQKTVGAGITLGAGTSGGACIDRWAAAKSNAAATATVKQTDVPGGVMIAGTNFAISGKMLRCTLTAAQTSLGASDYLEFYQAIEGIKLRSLIGGPTSLSIVTRSSVANLNFGVFLADSAQTYHLAKLCNLPNANAWTLIQLPNLPIWTPNATWPITPGVQGYYIIISIAAGPTVTSAETDVWAPGAINGVKGQSNFMASPVNSTFDLAFVQHEPGTTCGGIINIPFDQNLLDCQRYYQKSNGYTTKFPLSGDWQLIGQYVTSNAAVRAGIRLRPEMAKTPTVTWADHAGALNAVLVDFVGTVGVSNTTQSNTNTIGVISLSSNPNYGAPVTVCGQWQADSGW